MQKRIGIALFVAVCPLVYLKPHALIKSLCLRILFVNREPLNAAVLSRFPKERLLFGTDFPASLVFTDAADSLPDIPDEKQLSRLYADWHKKT